MSQCNMCLHFPARGNIALAIFAIVSLISSCTETVQTESPDRVGRSDVDELSKNSVQYDSMNSVDGAEASGVGNSACELDNSDITWVGPTYLGITYKLSDRALQYIGNTSGMVRDCLMGGLDDPARFAICHVMLIQIYDREGVFYGSLKGQIDDEEFTARDFGNGLVLKIGPGPVAPVFQKPEILREAWVKHLQKWDQRDPSERIGNTEAPSESVKSTDKQAK